VYAQSAPPNDPFFQSRGTWGQSYDDQWGLHRIGFDAAKEGAGVSLPEGRAPREVTVAVIDTGIDYTHPDLARESLWSNPKEKLNGIDDDRNGFIDDVIGWNFAEGSNNPWDRAGHGTLIAGIIAARSNNALGVAGVNPHARIMALEVLNGAGHGRSSQIAAAIYYAIANGAQVINLSLGGENLSALEQHAIRKALEAGLVVVVAAGNLGRNTEGFGIADLQGAIVVAATDPNDQRARFSNWGTNVGIAAPGVDILGLRARDTDFVRASRWASVTPGAAGGATLAAAVGAAPTPAGTAPNLASTTEATPNLSAGVAASAAVVGAEGHYYRASGTSFSAAFVSGVASWLLSMRPELNGTQAARMILQSARDIGPAGVDAMSGYGLIDARAALAADPEFWIGSRIASVDLNAQAGGDARIRILGTSDANSFAGARVRAAPEAYPNDWIPLGAPLTQPVRSGVLAEIDPRMLHGARRWIVQVITKHANGREREARYVVDLGAAP
jgi:subtilisin family serine protease